MNKKHCKVVTASILLFALGLSYLCMQAAAQGPDLTYGTTYPYIEVKKSPPVVGVPNALRLKVKNPNATYDAINVTVAFQISTLGVLGEWGWNAVGTSDLFNVSKNSEVWSPWTAWTPAESGHHCAQANITYALDPYILNNICQVNLEIRNSKPGGSMTIPFKLYPPKPDQNGTNLELTIVDNLPNETEKHFLPNPPPYNVSANSWLSLELNIELPQSTPVGMYNITIVGDENGTIFGSFTTYIKVSNAVGGYYLPNDKLALMIPYVGLSTAILGITIGSTIFAKHFKRKKEKR